MLRIAQSSAIRNIRQNVRHTTTRSKSSATNESKNFLAADTGPFATHIYHKLTTGLAIMTPIYLFAPLDSLPSVVDKSFSLAVSGTIAMHSWIGLNYVAVDYVPKISKSLLGPSRVLVAGVSVMTFLGLSKVSLMSEGGIKGLMKGLWGKTKPKKEEASK